MLRVVSVAGLAAVVTFDVELEDRRVMHKPVVFPDPGMTVAAIVRRPFRSFLSAISSNRTLVFS